MEDKSDINYLNLKFLILGESSIGKRPLLLRYYNKKNEQEYKDNFSSIGLDIKTKKLMINNTDVNIVIYDTAGQEKFNCLPKSFFKGADGILIGFDLTNPNTLWKVDSWIKQIEEKKEKDLSMVLFGTKCDDKENITVNKEDIKKIQEKYNIKYFETSAKDDTNVNLLFDYLIKTTLKTKGLLNRLGLSGNTPFDEIIITEKEEEKIDNKKSKKCLVF